MANLRNGMQMWLSCVVHAGGALGTIAGEIRLPVPSASKSKTAGPMRSPAAVNHPDLRFRISS